MASRRIDATSRTRVEAPSTGVVGRHAVVADPVALVDLVVDALVAFDPVPLGLGFGAGLRLGLRAGHHDTEKRGARAENLLARVVGRHGCVDADFWSKVAGDVQAVEPCVPLGRDESCIDNPLQDQNDGETGDVS